MRGNWARKCLVGSGGRKVVERLEARCGSSEDPRSDAEDFMDPIGVATVSRHSEYS
jgi:hypothetical protein